jgi:hypothetical protein
MRDKREVVGTSLLSRERDSPQTPLVYFVLRSCNSLLLDIVLVLFNKMNMSPLSNHRIHIAIVLLIYY